MDNDEDARIDRTNTLLACIRNAIASPAMKWKLQNLQVGIEKGLVEPIRFD